jgi:hypothetical protein
VPNLAAIGLSEVASGDLQHLDVVRLVALVNGAGDFPNWGNLLVREKSLRRK